jgi:hypothetical protein
MNYIKKIIINEIERIVQNNSQYIRYREKTTPENYYIIEDDSDDGYITSYYIEEEFDYLENKAKRLSFHTFAIDPKWKPSGGFSDLYSFTGKILKNPKALQLFMLEPQTDIQKHIKQRLIDWFKIAKNGNQLDLIPFLVEIMKINKDYQIQKRAQG